MNADATQQSDAQPCNARARLWKEQYHVRHTQGSQQEKAVTSD